MSLSKNVVPVVSLLAAFTALGISVANTKQVSELPTEPIVDLKVEALRTQITTALNERTDRFEKDVEAALESIIERRRAEAEKANSASANPQAPMGNLSSEGMLSMNADGQVVYGNPDAQVTIYTFEDFRCSFCARYHPLLQQYINGSDGQVNWIYKPYPILGPASEQLASAGECVAQIEGPDAFWRYSEQAYATKNWVSAIRASGIQRVDEVRTCVEQNAEIDRITQSLSEGRELNVTGTPASIFRNNLTEKGALVPGMLQPQQIGQMVQQILSEQPNDE